MNQNINERESAGGCRLERIVSHLTLPNNEHWIIWRILKFFKLHYFGIEFRYCFRMIALHFANLAHKIKVIGLKIKIFRNHIRIFGNHIRVALYNRRVFRLQRRYRQLYLSYLQGKFPRCLAFEQLDGQISDLFYGAHDQVANDRVEPQPPGVTPSEERNK